MNTIEHKNGPNIVVIYNNGHSKPEEQEIDELIEKIPPHEKIATLMESDYKDYPSLNHYSLELLNNNNPRSTASCCQMIVARTLMDSGRTSFAKEIIGLMYTDRYFRQLFEGDHYKKYSPEKYGLPRTTIDYEQPDFFHTINLIKELFKKLDNELSQQPLKDQECFLSDLLFHYTNMIIKGRLNNGKKFIPVSYKVLGPLSEALVAIKIKRITDSLKEKFDSQQECTLDLIKNFFYNPNLQEVSHLLKETNKKLRTQFQLQKIKKVYDDISSGKPHPKEWTLAIRVGSDHREVMTKRLRDEFGDSFKELNFNLNHSSSVEKLTKLINSRQQD